MMCTGSASRLCLQGRLFDAGSSISPPTDRVPSERRTVFLQRALVGEQPCAPAAAQHQSSARVAGGSCVAWDRRGEPGWCTRQKPSPQEIIKMVISEIKSQGRQLPDSCYDLSPWGIEDFIGKTASQSAEFNYTRTLRMSLANKHF